MNRKPSYVGITHQCTVAHVSYLNYYKVKYAESRIFRRTRGYEPADVGSLTLIEPF